MPRRGSVPKRKIKPDPKYGSELIAKFINCVMRRGKKSVAEKIVYGAFEIIQSKYKKDPLEVFHQAIENVKPRMEVRSRRVGGATYQVPMEIRPERRTSLAMRWIIQFAKGRGERGMKEKLAAELIDASQGKGASIKKKEDTHKMAEANKAFSHYRW